jgi:hypothetical protein
MSFESLQSAGIVPKDIRLLFGFAPRKFRTEKGNVCIDVAMLVGPKPNNNTNLAS